MRESGGGQRGRRRDHPPHEDSCRRPAHRPNAYPGGLGRNSHATIPMMAHAHAHADPAADRGRLRVALGLVLALMAGEVAAGLLAGSLALLSDAAHMLTDAAALGLALVSAGLAERPARGRFTFGLQRAEILSAQVNGATHLPLAAVGDF